MQGRSRGAAAGGGGPARGDGDLDAAVAEVLGETLASQLVQDHDLLESA